ncbi:helix-turn-helix domain-containing protein [Sinimarinibacterium sp. NLF-5-8]|uniref:AraC family transcriptional regulator n=1 Tax=Sinimarinibacterium sp. NLF-5-8 TaxID=2698684 RepID=UPI00137B9846|nr:helix-turn-helix transcriptional regulator [Sinimarinibacterium sp. NLF-5-8]QHS10373.1 helix-turn-helix transcriptional regulator [Sinimarinibacterium sp. NLF-5-8]
MGFSAEGETLALASDTRHVTGVAVHYPQGHVVPLHQHRAGHLIYADRGLLRIEAETGQWLVPPTAAVWLRPNVAHRLVVPVALQAHGLFVPESLCAQLPAEDGVVAVGGLLREVIIALARAPAPCSVQRAQLLSALLIEELRAPRTLPFHLPWPADAQMQRLCQALIDDPGQAATAQVWGERLAISSKTLHRRFLQGTGLTFGKWRQQLRLMHSLTQLLQGVPITQVALACGYDSHGAYATAFKKQFGQPPSVFGRQASGGAAPLKGR